MSEKKYSFVVIEKSNVKIYHLNEKKIWYIGRHSKDSEPDIVLESETISRKQGIIQNRDEEWLYFDNIGKNGTLYNKERIISKLPLYVKDGDVFVFGGPECKTYSEKTAWGFFLQDISETNWKCVNTEEMNDSDFLDQKGIKNIKNIAIGDVIRSKSNIIIYMGRKTYIFQCH